MTERNNQLIIIGAGSLGVMTLDAALEMDCYEKISFVDDNKNRNEIIHGHQVIGGMDVLEDLDENWDYIISIANNKVRKKISENFRLNYVNIIHPNVAISRFSEIGIGNIILPNTSIDLETIIKNHVILNKNNSRGHNVTMNNYAQASPGCNLGGIIDEGTFIGLGANILPEMKIGSWSTIGAGAVVTKDVPNNVTAVGVPAKIIKE